MYLFLAVLGLCCCEGFSLVAASGGYSPVAVHRFLIAVTCRGAQALRIQALLVAAPEL